MKQALSVASCIVLFAGCATMEGGPSATATVRPLANSQANGSVKFTQVGNRVRIVAEIAALPPGMHGFHIHEKGDCSAPDGMSTGGHFNPAAKKHGPPDTVERHGGDLGNLQADAYGRATLTMVVDGISIGRAGDGIIGRAVIVHANADDLKTDPTGNAGGRVACGVIEG